MGKNLSVLIFIAITILLAMASFFIVNGYFESKTCAVAASDPQIQIQVRADTLPAWQTAYMLNEIKDYRHFIEKERQEYQQFLARTFSTVGIIITALTGILTFLGIQSLKDLKTKAEAHYRRELSKTIKEKLEEDEQLVIALQALARKQAVWHGAKLRVITPEALINKMEPLEIAYFKKGKARPVVEPYKQGEDLTSYHAIIHCYVANTPVTEDGKISKDKKTDKDRYYDTDLVDKLLPDLKGRKIPLIVYNFHDKTNFIDPKAKSALNLYPYGSLANNPFSLVANTYDAITLHIPEKK